jgi:hypothetical protein
MPLQTVAERSEIIQSVCAEVDNLMSCSAKLRDQVLF